MKLETHHGKIDLGGLCLRTDTLHGKPIMKMEPTLNAKEKFLAWFFLTALTAGIGLNYASNREQYVPAQQIAQHMEYTPTPYK